MTTATEAPARPAAVSLASRAAAASLVSAVAPSTGDPSGTVVANGDESVPVVGVSADVFLFNPVSSLVVVPAGIDADRLPSGGAENRVLQAGDAGGVLVAGEGDALLVGNGGHGVLVSGWGLNTVQLRQGDAGIGDPAVDALVLAVDVRSE